MSFSFNFPYKIETDYKKCVAYFCMEFGIEQPLKTYAGGLGFLAGSYMRSSFELKQNMIGIGILWKYGYYNQVRKPDQSMDILFEERKYGFLKETGIRFNIDISGHKVWVGAWYLPPEVFNTAPIFFLTTDLPDNDYLAQTISHKLYDPNPETKIAAAILLGLGGAKLLETLNLEPDIYHLNESHALPLIFYLYNKYKSPAEVRKRVVFTNHTPEMSGNQKTDILLLEKMGYFCGIPQTEIRTITGTEGNELDHTLTALRMAGKANAVSELHRQTLLKMWGGYSKICDIISITNGQNYRYWHSESLYNALNEKRDEAFRSIKKRYKKALIDEVADQCGEIYSENICTIVFAKRFAGYKRPGLLLHDMDRFHQLVTNQERPVQIIWAGKPYPMDYAGIGVFDNIANVCKTYFNCAVLTGYEIKLSRLLKRGADIWLNIPRLRHEASGTSGISAAMNGAMNVALPDGWFPEFAKDKINSFVIAACDPSLPEHQQDDLDAASLYDLLEKEVLPMYYDYPQHWLEIIKQGMQDIVPRFGSNRMAAEYYEKLYN